MSGPREHRSTLTLGSGFVGPNGYGSNVVTIYVGRGSTVYGGVLSDMGCVVNFREIREAHIGVGTGVRCVMEMRRGLGICRRLHTQKRFKGP